MRFEERGTYLFKSVRKALGIRREPLSSGIGTSIGTRAQVGPATAAVDFFVH